MEETVEVPEHIKYDYYKNGIDKSIEKQEVMAFLTQR